MYKGFFKKKNTGEINMSELKLKTIILTVLIGTIAVLFSGCSAQEAYRLIKVNSFEGEVSIQREERLSVFEGLQLITEDSVEVGNASFLELLADSDKHIAAEENTGFVLHSTGDEESGSITIDLLYGKSLFTIDNKLSENSSFIVTTPNATLSVRGTSFYVEYNRETGETKVEVIEGKVWVSYNNREEMLKKGDTLTITASVSETKAPPEDNTPQSPSRPTGEVSLMRMFRNVPDYLTAEPDYYELYYVIGGNTDNTVIRSDSDEELSGAMDTASEINGSYIEPYMDSIQNTLDNSIDDHFFEGCASGSGSILIDITHWYKNTDSRFITVKDGDYSDTIEFSRAVFQFIISDMSEEYAAENAAYLLHSGVMDGRVYAVSGIMITFYAENDSATAEPIELTVITLPQTSDSVGETSDFPVAEITVDTAVSETSVPETEGAVTHSTETTTKPRTTTTAKTTETGTVTTEEVIDYTHISNPLLFSTDITYVHPNRADSTYTDLEYSLLVYNSYYTGNNEYYNSFINQVGSYPDTPLNDTLSDLRKNCIDPHSKDILEIFNENKTQWLKEAQKGTSSIRVDVTEWFPDTIVLKGDTKDYTYKIKEVNTSYVYCSRRKNFVPDTSELPDEYYFDGEDYKYIGGVCFNFSGSIIE